MSSASIHKKLNRVRKPRVHITYDVETEGAIEKRELPMVIGVMGDYVGNNPGKDPGQLRDRRFIQIDRDNINEVMASHAPGLSMRVDNLLEPVAEGEPTQMGVQLQFRSMEDFEPGAVVQQVEPLRRLLEVRNKLRDLLAKADRSEDLEGLLERVLQNTSDLEKLSQELNQN